MGTETHRLIVALPAFNEAGNLPALLADIAAQNLPDCLTIVVDDGSNDDTAALAEAAAQTQPVLIHRHAENRGLGAAVRTLMDLALPRLKDDGVLITMDADGSHRPEQIPAMLARIDAGADVVIASRYTQRSRTVGVPAFRRFLSLGARALLQTLFAGRNVRDFTCGFRAIRASALRRATAGYAQGLATEPGFSVTVEVLVKLLRTGATPDEIGMDLRYDLKRGASKIRVARTVWAYLKLLPRLALARPSGAQPLRR